MEFIFFSILDIYVGLSVDFDNKVFALLHYSVFRCTINAIPHTQSLLNKSRLPLGILIHPFKDLAVSSMRLYQVSAPPSGV